jgi:hypothetical protein
MQSRLVAFRLAPIGHGLLRDLARELGISKSAVIRRSLRMLAAQHLKSHVDAASKISEPKKGKCK